MNLSAEKRKSRILYILNEKKRVSVRELEETLNVSGVTIRNDLSNLEKEEFLYRVHGGALIREKLEYEFSFQRRLEVKIEEKKSIARKALGLVREGDFIFLDSGTTLLEFAKLLKEFRNLCVVTNSFPVCLELASSPGIELIGIGGRVNPEHFAFAGSNTIRYLKEFNFDRVFLGTDGFSIEKGLTTNDINMAEVERTAMQQSRECIVLADSGKMHSVGFATSISSLARINILVTDWKMDREYLRRLEAEGVKVLPGDEPAGRPVQFKTGGQSM